MAVQALKDEKELLAKIAEGDQYAFTILFNHYQKDVFVHSKRMTPSEDDALEVVQDIFIKIWTGRKRLNTVDNFGAYLNRVVRNQVFDVLKHISREAESNFKLQKESTEFDDSTRQLLDYKDAVNMLDEALSALAPQQKIAYRLCHQEGMKYEEAAKEMNISTETLRAHMKQALQKIRAHFRKHAVLYPMLILALHK
ncbi:RNA polymerase sigma factor [Pedobacter sp. MC2016-24]|uniref:RNA polymerase sigma factor n=1 Tax=Pedobacter sp. MC2016-24 TaxID=2780090 RepID=UPI00187FD720|nr:sigma-70 family RNA polymerase sigma factor [Pedobacter sp. MC2016-24]MBE9598027.1 sigma-70 family RNA polymerase sigma factor [Pedobacter sp. MC2016-24]